MTQGSLFPLQVKHHRTPKGGRDVRVDADAEDGMRWTLKRCAEHPMLPAAEFLAYRLAHACGLPAPHFGILRDLDGALVFGSRHEGGLVDLKALTPDQQLEELSHCAGRMSACFALDLVLGNEDRHFDNFVYRRRDDGRLTAMPIDWGRAWWVTGWPPRDVHTRACTTTTQIDLLRALNVWQPAEALMALGTLSSIPLQSVLAWADEMPIEWLPAAERGKLIAWWASEAFHARISSIISKCR